MNAQVRQGQTNGGTIAGLAWTQTRTETREILHIFVRIEFNSLSKSSISMSMMHTDASSIMQN